MKAIVSDLPVHYIEHGRGTPVLALHGWMSHHGEMTGALEPFFRDRPGFRRIYLDLPGMGQTPAPATVNTADDLLDILLGFVDSVIGEEAFLVVGHSYGGYLARAVANRRSDQVQGLAAICPVIAMGQSATRQVPDHLVLHDTGDLSGILTADAEAEFRNYLVVQTPETLRRFQEEVAPALTLTDWAAIERIGEHSAPREAPEAAAAYTKPTLIVTGRQDATVGYADQWSLIDHYPRATFAVLDRAGHALLIEQPTLLNALLAEWLDRVQEHRAGRTADPAA